MNRVFFFLTGLLVFASSCRESQKNDTPRCKVVSSYHPRFAKGFIINYYNGFKELQVLRDGKVAYSYIQYPQHKARPIGFSSAKAVPDSLSSTVLLSTSHIAAFSILESIDKVKAVANSKLIYDSTVVENVRRSFISDIGLDYNPDYEKIISIRPQLLFSDGEYATQNSINEKLENAGTVIVHPQDYKEQHPLARAEWIIFFSFFINKENDAIKFFENVSIEYENVKTLIAMDSKSPTVFCNYPYNGTWYVPAKYNYVTNLLADAGLDYIWKNDLPNNGLNLSLTFEDVYRKAKDAQYWILFSSEKNKSELAQKDARLTHFDAYKACRVISSNIRVNQDGANDYWEYGVFRPDLVLNDFYRLFHQEDTTSLSFFKPLQ